MKGKLKGLLQFILMMSLLIGLMLSVEACRKKTVITNVPIGVSAQEVADWYQAVGANEFVADTLNNATKLVDSLHGEKLPNGHAVIGDEYYIPTQTSLGRAAQAGKRITAVLKASPQHFNQSTKDQVNALLDETINQVEIANTQGLTGISDQAKAKQYNDLINSIEGSLQTIRLLVAIKGGA